MDQEVYDALWEELNDVHHPCVYTHNISITGPVREQSMCVCLHHGFNSWHGLDHTVQLAVSAAHWKEIKINSYCTVLVTIDALGYF